MDRKQAYCCLNCTNLPPCNAAAGNCKECCKDCKDTSVCLSSAYFDGVGFYKKWTMTDGYSLSGTPCDISFCGYFNSSYNATWHSDGTFNSFRNVDADGIGDDHDCISYSGASTAKRTAPGGSIKKSGSIYFCEYDFGCGKGTLNCANGEITPPCDGCCAIGVTCAGEPSQIEAAPCPNITAKITFSEPVKLYNNKGEEVGLEAYGEYPPSYDPCYAIRGWGPPGCHFFAP
jgi:hypothetical protein